MKTTIRRKNSPRFKARKRQGAILLEFGITMPLMLLLAIAVFDFARVTYFGLVVADAAGAASRYAAFNPVTDVSEATWYEGLEQAAKSAIVGSPWVSQNQLVVHPALIEQVSPVEKRITVKVSYPYQVQLWWPGLPSNPNVSCQVSVIGAS